MLGCSGSIRERLKRSRRSESCLLRGKGRVCIIKGLLRVTRGYNRIIIGSKSRRRYWLRCELGRMRGIRILIWSMSNRGNLCRVSSMTSQSSLHLTATSLSRQFQSISKRSYSQKTARVNLKELMGQSLLKPRRSCSLTR